MRWLLRFVADDRMPKRVWRSSLVGAALANLDGALRDLQRQERSANHARYRIPQQRIESRVHASSERVSRWIETARLQGGELGAQGREGVAHQRRMGRG